MGKEVEPYNCWDDVVVNGDEELENILGILDFPMESLEGDGFIGDWDASKSQYFGPIPSDVLIDTGPPPPAPIAPKKCANVQEQGVFHTESPISVLESNGSSSAVKIPPCISKRTRSKRARPSGLSPWLLTSPLFAAARKTCNARKSRERRKKLTQLEDSSDKAEPQNGASQRVAVPKKCTHCEVMKTPQWREGPMGPKTLCNACGVRYWSGRLFSEYRPAASPTFVRSLHSNSHRKVIEMRTKAEKQKANKIEEPSTMSPQMEFVPMSSYLFDHIC